MPSRGIRPVKAMVAGRVMIVEADVVDAADEGHLVHALGQPGQVLADAHAGGRRGNGLELAPHLGRRVGLGVKSVEVAWAAVIEDEDARPDRAGRPGPAGWLAARACKSPGRLSPSPPDPMSRSSWRRLSAWRDPAHAGWFVPYFPPWQITDSFCVQVLPPLILDPHLISHQFQLPPPA